MQLPILSYTTAVTSWTLVCHDTADVGHQCASPVTKLVQVVLVVDCCLHGTRAKSLLVSNTHKLPPPACINNDRPCVAMHSSHSSAAGPSGNNLFPREMIFQSN